MNEIQSLPLQKIVLIPAYTGIEKRNPALAEYRRFVETRIKPLRDVTVEYPEALYDATRAAFVSQIQIGKVTQS